MNIEKLRHLASLATQGPWQTLGDYVAEQDGTRVASLYSRLKPDEQIAADVAYVAACDPQTILALLDKIARYEARLEIDHCFVMVDGKELVRQEIPADEREGWPDGIMARDETIKLLEQQIARSGPHP